MLIDHPVESDIVELKRDRSGKKWGLEDLAAFANTRGGSLVIGVDDDGTVVGFDPTDAELRTILGEIVDTLDLRPEVVRLPTNTGARVLELRVMPPGRLVSCNGRYLVRVGTTNRTMTDEELARRSLEVSGQSWDSLPGGTDRDIDPERVAWFADVARRGRLPHASSSDRPEAVLNNIGLRRDGRPTRAGVLVFGFNPSLLVPACRVHVGRFSQGRILDDRMFEGNLLTQLEGVLGRLETYLLSRLEVSASEGTRMGVGRIIGGTGERYAPNPAIPDSLLTIVEVQRREVWEYPLVALREALVNALIHRDYSDPGDVQVRVHDDSLEIFSPGGLPFGMTVEALRTEGHLSRPRNPLLAQAFYLASLVERWGSGTTRMIQACRDQGLPEPELLEVAGGFKVVFRKDRVTRASLQAAGLNERQVELMVWLSQEVRRVTNAGYQALMGVPRRTAVRDLSELVERGLLERVGSGRATTYRLRTP